MPEQPPKRPLALWAVGLIVLVLSFDVAFFWQRTGGAYQNEFGGHPDEAAHYVTGLFIHDAGVEAWRYAAQGFHGSPVQVGRDFANNFYQHYPKVGLGVWPPVFYLVQAGWTLPLGVSRAALLWLMALLAAVLAWLVFRALQRSYGVGLAALGAVLMLSLPLVRSYYGMVMAEMLSGILMFGAMLAFGRFLDREKRADALWFGLLAALAILTKGTGLALALAAPLAILLTRRFHLLKRSALWLAVALVVVIAGPWTWATRELGKGGWLQPNPSWEFTREALAYYAGRFALALGWVPLGLFAVGVWIKIRKPGSEGGRWAAAGALIVSVLLFQSLVPVGMEARHLIPALPAAILFAVAALGEWRLRMPPRVWVAVLILVILGVSLTPQAPALRRWGGFAPLAAEFFEESAPDDTALVSSDATGEGMFIAEIAGREPRPGHLIQRASKSLASSTWSGSGYQPAFTEDQDVVDFLQKNRIQWLIVDPTLPADKRRTHHDQLQRLVEARRDIFQPIAESEIWRGGERQTATAKLYKIARKR